MTDLKVKNRDFYEPFLISLKEVFEMMMDCDVEFGKPSVKNSRTLSLGYTSIIGMNGHCDFEGKCFDFKGNFSLSTNEETFVNTANALLQEDHTSFNDEIADTGNEIVNMVMGNVKKHLARLGYSFDLATPSFIVGEHYEIVPSKVSKTIIVPFKNNLGDFFMELNVSQIVSDN